MFPINWTYLESQGAELRSSVEVSLVGHRTKWRRVDSEFIRSKEKISFPLPKQLHLGSPPYQLMEKPSCFLLQEKTRSHLWFSRWIYQEISLALPSKCIQTLTTFHHFHCYHPCWVSITSCHLHLTALSTSTLTLHEILNTVNRVSFYVFLGIYLCLLNCLISLRLVDMFPVFIYDSSNFSLLFFLGQSSKRSVKIISLFKELAFVFIDFSLVFFHYLFH